MSIFNKKINIVASWKSQQHCLPYFEQKINRKWKVALFLHIKNRHFVLKIPLRRKMSLFGNTSFIKMVSKGKIWKTFCATSHEGLLEAAWSIASYLPVFGRVKTYINGCIFKIHPLRYTVKYTSTGVFSKIGKFWNYTLWSIKRQNCLCTATGVFSKMKCLILFQKFYESICIWMSNTWIRNTWLLE